MRLAPLWLVGLLFASPALAHPLPKSEVFLDIRARRVELELRLPVDRLQVALRHDRFGASGVPDPDGAAMLGPARARVAEYVLGHVRATDPAGTPWSVRLVGLEEEPSGGMDNLVVRLAMQPPPGAGVDRLDLHYDVITRELVTHAALVSVRTDWRNGVSADSPQLLGAMGARRTHLPVDRSGGSAWRGFRKVFALGVDHIAEGTDHLLFLLTLLLPAPLVAAGGRWAGPGRPGRSLLRVAQIVTAFTLGHSLTLLLGATGAVRVPEAPVEVLIAASILVSAVHALRPIFPGREFVVAGAFGLVHGLAFATALSDLGLDGWGMALGILGFNLGIEAMQLAVVAATMPWLLLLGTTRAYPVVRVAGAGFAAVAALGWMAERALGWANPAGPVVDALAARAPWAVAALAAASLIAFAAQWASSRRDMWSTSEPRPPLGSDGGPGGPRLRSR